MDHRLGIIYTSIYYQHTDKHIYYTHNLTYVLQRLTPTVSQIHVCRVLSTNCVCGFVQGVSQQDATAKSRQLSTPTHFLFILLLQIQLFFSSFLLSFKCPSSLLSFHCKFCYFYLCYTQQTHTNQPQNA